jgi:hypothetical protein
MDKYVIYWEGVYNDALRGYTHEMLYEEATSYMSFLKSNCRLFDYWMEKVPDIANLKIEELWSTK